MINLCEYYCYFTFVLCISSHIKYFLSEFLPGELVCLFFGKLLMSKTIQGDYY